MLWKGFQRPKRLECESETLTATYGKFTAQPFERGFGTTIGNALRRVLLSSIEGTAELISTTYEPLPRDVKAGDPILLDDGNLELRVERHRRLLAVLAQREVGVRVDPHRARAVGRENLH